MAICSNIDESILNEFRDVVYQLSGLKQGDFKKSLEAAMIDYVVKYSSTNTKDIQKKFLYSIKTFS